MKIITLFAILLAAEYLASSARASAPGTITQLKPLYPATELVAVDGAARCVIVTPGDPAMRVVAEQLARDIEQRTQTRPEILTDTALVSPWWEIDFAKLGDRHVLALGTINSNRLLARLWGEDYTREDDAFPGPGGYVVRTVHDPFARGLNVVVLGATAPEDVARASSLLLDKHARLDSRALLLPEPIVAVVRGANVGRDRFRFTPPAEFAESLARRVTSQVSQVQDEAGARVATLTNLTNILAQLAQAWFHTGDPGYPPLMKRLLDEHSALLDLIPRRVEMEPASASAMTWWDTVEELSVWTDEDRLALSNAILRDAQQGHEHTPAYELVKDGYVQVLTENHGTNSVLNTYQHWRYFAKYYDLPEERYWLDVVAATFAGQIASHQILEDSSTYMPFCPEDAAAYAFQSRDMRFFQLGIARTQWEFILQCCYSNLGLSSGFGDANFLRFPWGVNAVGLMGWFERDPRAAWWWRRYLPEACGVLNEVDRIPVDLAGELREPTEWSGLHVFPVYQQALGGENKSKVVVTTPKEVADPELFNKLVFRERWSPDAQYLLLDGAGSWRATDNAPYEPGPAGHHHDDINTIVTFTDEGRMWLVDHTYSDRAIQAHSGLTITRDGEFKYRKHLARLKNAVEGAGFAITRTTFDDYSGATWERTIFWRRGGHFVVLDRAIAELAGTFSVRCAFRGLGEPDWRGSELRLTQAGRHFQIVSDGAASTVVEDFIFPTANAWKSAYTHAEPVARVFEQYKAATLAPGEAIVFANYLQAAGDGATLDATSLQTVGQSAVIARNDVGEFIYGLGAPAGTEAVCDAHAVTADGVLLAGLRRLGPETALWLASDSPVDLSFDAAGQATVRTTRATQLQIGGARHLLTAGETELRDALLISRLATIAGRTRASAAQLVAGAHPTVPGNPALDRAKILTPPRVELATPARRMLAVELERAGDHTWLVTGRDGLSAFTPEGKLRWRFAPGQACGALAAADLDGDGRLEIAVGCDDGKVYVIDAAGRERWNYACKTSHMSAPPTPDDVQFIDLDGDGPRELVVIGNWIHVFEADGTLRWEDYWRYQRGRHMGDAQSMAISDYNRDGKLEIMLGVRLNYPIALGYDAHGKRVYPADPTGQPNHSKLRVNPPNDILLLDLFGDGGNEMIVVAASDQLNVRWAGGERDTLRAGDFPGGHLLLASATPPGERPLLFGATDMGALFAYRVHGGRADNTRIDLRTEWRQIVGEKITALWGGTLRGRPVALLGTQGGRFFVFDGRSGMALARMDEIERGSQREVRPPDAGDVAVTAIVPDVASASVLVLHADGRVSRIEPGGLW